MTFICLLVSSAAIHFMGIDNFSFFFKVEGLLLFSMQRALKVLSEVFLVSTEE